jgi:hypothetical protein
MRQVGAIGSALASDGVGERLSRGAQLSTHGGMSAQFLALMLPNCFPKSRRA